MCKKRVGLRSSCLCTHRHADTLSKRRKKLKQQQQRFDYNPFWTTQYIKVVILLVWCLIPFAFLPLLCCAHWLAIYGHLNHVPLRCTHDSAQQRSLLRCSGKYFFDLIKYGQMNIHEMIYWKSRPCYQITVMSQFAHTYRLAVMCVFELNWLEEVI